MSHSSTQSNRGFLVTGTDTGIGKTIVCAMLVKALDAAYFKPVQAGLDEPTDTDTVKILSGATSNQIFREIYRLKEPASPHLSAAMEGIRIETDQLKVPDSDCPLIVEGAGGVMVPLTNEILFLDVFARWRLPAIVVARTSLGTINHTLLSVKALCDHGVPVHGVIFVGDAHEENERIIPHFGNIPRLGRVPFLDPLDSDSLSRVFQENFDIADFHAESIR